MKIKGKDEFLRQIAALPDAIRSEVRKSLETSADEATDVMKRFAPVKTGKLRASIGYSFGEAPKGTINTAAKAARAAKSEIGLAVTIYAGSSEAFYARFQEFGTQKMPANPFFYPAYRLTRKRAKSRLSRAIRNGAKKAGMK